MQASELRPGQWFEWDNERWLCVRVTDIRCIAVDIDGHDYSVGLTDTVTPLNVTGWDDEPSEWAGKLDDNPTIVDEPPPLQLREGAWYRRRDGKVVGPCMPNHNTETPWNIEGNWYFDDGIRYCHPDTTTNLIAEVPPPVEPEQFKPGDWVVVVSHSVFRGKTGIVTEIVCGKHDTLPVHIEFADESNWFGLNEIRRATPAEVAAYKQAQEPQPDADGWIEWKGGECPVDGKQLVEIKCRGESVKTGTGPAHMWLWKHSKSDSDIDITHYRLVPSPQPAPIITDWVEVVTR